MWKSSNEKFYNSSQISNVETMYHAQNYLGYNYVGPWIITWYFFWLYSQTF